MPKTTLVNKGRKNGEFQFDEDESILSKGKKVISENLTKFCKN